MRELQRLNRLFEVSLYILVLLPFSMIALGGSIGPVMTGVFALGLPASIWFHKRRLAKQSQAVWWNILVILFLLGLVGQVSFTEMSILDGGIRFVLVLTLIKLFSRLSERDELQIFALTFLGLAAATTVNEDLTFGLLFAVYVFVGTVALGVFHLRSELTARPRLALHNRETSLNRWYVAVLLAMGGLILSVSLSIFFLFPRIGLGFFADQAREGVSVAGFSDEVTLGQHGAIRNNPQVVMRVEYLDSPPVGFEQLHWRTMTFDTYDGTRWSRASKGHRRALPIWDDGARLTSLHTSSGEGPRLQVYLEPLGADLVPVLRPTYSVRLGTTDYVLPFGPRAGHLQADRYDDIHHTIEAEVAIAYILTPAKSVQDIDREPPPDRYLQLPDLTPRVRQLAVELTQGATTNTARATAIKSALQARYTYTTDLPPVGADPIDAFLFENKEGHCEYFATATVLLLRANGVPARLVNGFLGGEWNAVGNYVAVRQGDAHSWAEYWDPKQGWTQLDSTPVGDGPQANPWTRTARATWDAMRMTWTKWVIEYDLNAQVDVLRKLARVLEPRGLMQDQEQKKAKSAQRTADWRSALLIGGLATLLFAAFIRTRRRLQRRDTAWRTTLTGVVYVGSGMLWSGWFQGFETIFVAGGGAFVAIGVVAALLDRTRSRAEQPAAAAFELIERAASRHGLGRRVDEGPEQFLRRLAAQKPAAGADLERFTPHYLRARFGDGADGEEAERLLQAAGRIADKLHKN